jgi:hypothetical protein
LDGHAPLGLANELEESTVVTGPVEERQPADAAIQDMKHQPA